MIKKLTLNARKPDGFWGRIMLKKMNMRHQPLINWGLDMVEIGSKDMILDVGCGGGKAVNMMSKRTPNGVVYGIDYSELAFANSEKENRKEISIKKVKILKASVSNIPFNDKTFDLVTAFETIYFWPNLKSDLKEILRVLKDSGNILIVCEMFKGKDKNQEHQGIVDLLKIDKNYLSKEELEEMVLNAGFNNVKTKVDEDKKWIAVLAKK